MAVTVFKCRAAASITMMEKDAKPILNLLGKDVKRGVITAAEAPAAAQKIEALVAKDKELEKMTALEQVRLKQQQAEQNTINKAEDHEKDDGPRISFAVRSYPLLQMLKAAIREEKDIMWGV